MKKSWRRFTALALAMVLGLSGVWSGNILDCSLHTVRAAEEEIDISTCKLEELKPQKDYSNGYFDAFLCIDDNNDGSKDICYEFTCTGETSSSTADWQTVANAVKEKLGITYSGIISKAEIKLCNCDLKTESNTTNYTYTGVIDVTVTRIGKGEFTINADEQKSQSFIVRYGKALEDARIEGISTVGLEDSFEAFWLERKSTSDGYFNSKDYSVKWSSSDEKVAIISDTSDAFNAVEVTPKSVGKTTITLEITDLATNKKTTATHEITVQEQPTECYVWYSLRDDSNEDDSLSVIESFGSTHTVRGVDDKFDNKTFNISAEEKKNFAGWNGINGGVFKKGDKIDLGNYHRYYLTGIWGTVVRPTVTNASNTGNEAEVPANGLYVDSGSTGETVKIDTISTSSADMANATAIESTAKSLYQSAGASGNEIKAVYFDIALASGKATSNGIIHIQIPYNTDNKYAFAMWRYHSGQVQRFTEDDEEKFEKEDGHFYQKDGMIHIFTSQFSTYALTYSTKDVTLKSASTTANSSSSSTGNSTTSKSVTTTTSSARTSSGGGGGNGTSIGKVRSSGTSKAYYKKTGKSSVKYTVTAVSDSAKTATVPATVKVGKQTYNVTAISSYALSGYYKLTSVTIGKNVKKIGKNAFSGDTKLSSITVNSKKLTAKNIKGAFKGASIKTVYVPADKVQAYKKVFTKKITGNKNKIAVKAKKVSGKK